MKVPAFLRLFQLSAASRPVRFANLSADALARTSVPYTFTKPPIGLCPQTLRSTMPKAFLIRKKLGSNWCPVTPPPSPDDIAPENLSLKNEDHHHAQQQIITSTFPGQNKFMPYRRPSTSTHSIGENSVLNLKNAHSSVSRECCEEPCAVDLSMSAKTDTSSTSYSPRYGSSSLSSPISYSASESDFDVKGMCTGKASLAKHDSDATSLMGRLHRQG